jgi:hypothetical protein
MSSSWRAQRSGGAEHQADRGALANLDKVFQTSCLANEMRAVYHGLEGEEPQLVAPAWCAVRVRRGVQRRVHWL